VIGDCAYPVLASVLTPWKRSGNLSAMQVNFNKMLSADRTAIERAFALLKGKCRRVKYLDVNSVETASRIVSAACVIHNMYIASAEWNEADFDPIEEDGDQAGEDGHFEVNEGSAKRQVIAERLYYNV